MVKLCKILFVFLLLSSQAFALPYLRRNTNVIVGANSSGKIDYPDDVKEYTNRVEQCYKLKQNKYDESAKTQMIQLHCDHLQQDSQHMHYVYYQNTKIIDYINKYERSYPFFAN